MLIKPIEPGKTYAGRGILAVSFLSGLMDAATAGFAASSLLAEASELLFVSPDA